mgnify:CR=1 FL=1
MNLVSIKIPILIRILLVKLALPRVLAAPNLLLVQQQQIDLVLVAGRDNTKILLHTQVLPVNHALLPVVLVPNFQLVRQQQIEHVQNVDLVSIKIQILIQVLPAKVVQQNVVSVRDRFQLVLQSLIVLVLFAKQDIIKVKIITKKHLVNSGRFALQEHPSTKLKKLQHQKIVSVKAAPEVDSTMSLIRQNAKSVTEENTTSTQNQKRLLIVLIAPKELSTTLLVSVKNVLFVHHRKKNWKVKKVAMVVLVAGIKM